VTEWRGFVINLERRPDRLSAFNANVGEALKGMVDIQPRKAVDGAALVFDEELRTRINPWNFKHMSEPMLRGYVGNALSLLSIFESVALMKDRFVFVFEDDARLINQRVVGVLRDMCDHIPNADLIWLNDYDRSSTKAERIANRLKLACAPMLPWTTKRWSAQTERTTEAFVTSPRFAARFAGAFERNLGACDEHIRTFVSQQSDIVCLCISPPIFTQADRSDSDVR
jgi:GR25 family glycosyltransferase involved in LPS biosynthesis